MGTGSSLTPSLDDVEASQLKRRVELGQLLEGRESFGRLLKSGLCSTDATYEVISPSLTSEGCSAPARARGRFGPSSSEGATADQADPLVGPRTAGLDGTAAVVEDDAKIRM